MFILSTGAREPIDLLMISAFGWLVGSLVNYLADVLPLFRHVHKPLCLHCQMQKSWWSVIIPTRCKHCGKSPGLRPWVVNIFFVSGITWLSSNYPRQVGFYLATFVLAYLCLVAVIDIEYRVVLNEVSIAGALIGLIAGTWLHGLPRTLLGGAAGFSAMLLFYGLGIYYLRRRSARPVEKAEDDALGFGDVNLSGVIGLLLGWPGVLAGLFLGVLLGGAFSLVIFIAMMVQRQYRPDASIPYGPFLAAGAAILLIFRSAIL